MSTDTVLIVDDEKDNLQALSRLLRTQCEVVTTTSPFEALKQIQSTDFATIISDQRMPEMTGVDLLEKAKNVKPLTTRILLTGYTDIEAVIEAINRGNVYRYIAKPWDPDDLKLTVRQAVEAYHLRKELGEKNLALTQAVEDLKVLDKAKSRFLSLISHELNTPLTVLVSFTDLLQEKKSELPPMLQKTVAGIVDARKRFEEIVSEVLTYIRLESGALFLRQEINLSKTLREAADKLKAQLVSKKLSIKFELAKDLRYAGDPEKISVAFEKLLEDFIRQAPPETDIQLELEETTDMYVVTIRRKGEPIKEENLLPFESTGKQIHHHKDLGLRLALCKLVIEGHGGKLSIGPSKAGYTSLLVSLPNTKV